MQYKAVTFLLAAAVAGNGQERFTFRAIDFPQAVMTQAWGINARGEVVGYYSDANNAQHGFRLAGDRYASIDFPGASATSAFGINVHGDIVGTYVVGGVTHGFLLNGNRFTSIDYPGAERTEAAGINASGDIVGVFVKAGANHGFILRGSEFEAIDYPGATATGANGLNDRGDVVGNYSLAGVTRGYLLRDGRFTTIEYKDATFTGALGINAAGEITGRYRDASVLSRGFVLHPDGQFETFDYPASTFTSGAGINTAGEVVGRFVAGGITRGMWLTSERQVRYSVSDLGGLGGHMAGALGVNNAGAIAGGATLPGDNMHPVLWRNGRTTDLGTLGGPNGIATNPNGANQVSVVAETVTTDPLQENFCGWGSQKVCLGAIWQDGKLTALSTLGGNNAIAFGLNERGQIAGTAEKSTRDTACPAPQVLSFAPVIWGANGKVQELPLPGVDKVGFAIGINDKGEAVGGTGSCADTAVSATGLNFSEHAVLWQNGVPLSLAPLEGPSIAVALNNRTEVVGGSAHEDGSIHAFLWTREAGLRPIPAVEGDGSLLPTMINNNRQVVGASCDEEFNCRAFVWDRNGTVDLNALIPADSPLYLAFALWINDAGEIVGQAVDKSTGEMRAFVASPLAGGKPSSDPTAPAYSGSSPRVREMLQQHLRDGGLTLPYRRPGKR